MSKAPVDVMLSIHCGTMLEPARKLRDFLVSRGFTVFLCEQMAGGVDFRLEISENAVSCRSFVPFMNKRWCESGECKFEFQAALRVNLISSKPILIPLILEDFNFNGIVAKPEGLNDGAWEKVLTSLDAGRVLPSAAAVPIPVPQLDPAPAPAKPKLKPVEVFAGKGAKGNRNGPLIFSSFASITSLAADESSIYVSTLSHTVRKIDLEAGEVSTFAGFQDEDGAEDGCVESATLRSIAGIAVTPDGSLYLADGNRKIRKISDGSVFTLAGSGQSAPRGKNQDGPANWVALGTPGSIAFNRKNKAVYFVDKDSESIRRFSAGTVTTIAGTGKSGFADGAGKTAQFDGPEGIALIEADGSLIVADRSNNRIRKIAADGTVSTFAGTGKSGEVDGPVSEAMFYYPTALAVDPRNSAIYVVDQFGSQIRKIVNGVVTTIAALPNSKIVALLVHGGVLYVAEPYTIRTLPIQA